MSEIVVLSGSELQALMRFGDYVGAVAEGFRMFAQGRAASPLPLHIPARDGGFHVKAATLTLARSYAAIKTNANFPHNRQRAGLPTIQGAILLFDATVGTPLALLDAIEITLKRTGAATAIAARYLARPESRVATVCGCGEQGRSQLAALQHELTIERVFAWDADADVAARYARAMADQHGVEVEATSDLASATLQSDIIVTCTSSAVPYLGSDHVKPGTFIAAVGADNPHKSEIVPELMARATVVGDIAAQCVIMGDTHHAIRSGAMRGEDIHAELGDLIAGRKAGRRTPDEITVFDSTGTGIQDVAAAAVAFERACELGAGTRVSLS
jgi:ornithine cyclodeaminase/alanine dehydrogenase